MLLLWITIIWLVSLVFAYYYNTKNYKKRTNLENALVSLLESFIILGIVILIGFIGFVEAPFWFYVALFGCLGLGYLRFYTQKIDDKDDDLLIESIKNSVIISLTTLLPFFISMTIFRYQSFIVQMLISLVIAFATFYSSPYLQKVPVSIYNKLKFKIDLSGSRRWYALLTIFVIIMTTVMIFEFPSYRVNNFLNLDNHKPVYGLNKGYDFDIQNNYEAVELTSYKLNSLNMIPHDDLIEFNEDTVEFTDGESTYKVEAEGFKSIYTKETNGSEETYSLMNFHNENAIIIDGVVYWVGIGEQEIEIMDGEFRFTHLHKIPMKDPLLYHDRYFHFSVFFRVVDDELHYITSEYRANEYHITEYKLVKEPVDIPMPFYSHYSFIHIVVVMVFVFVPITDYKKHITYIDYQSQLNKKDTK